MRAGLDLLKHVDLSAGTGMRKRNRSISLEASSRGIFLPVVRKSGMMYNIDRFRSLALCTVLYCTLYTSPFSIHSTSKDVLPPLLNPFS